jgi:hypothetical protein
LAPTSSLLKWKSHDPGRYHDAIVHMHITLNFKPGELRLLSDRLPLCVSDEWVLGSQLLNDTHTRNTSLLSFPARSSAHRLLSSFIPSPRLSSRQIPPPPPITGMMGSTAPALPGPDPCPGYEAARSSSLEAAQLGLHRATLIEQDVRRAGMEALRQVGQRVSAAKIYVPHGRRRGRGHEPGLRGHDGCHTQREEGVAALPFPRL